MRTLDAHTLALLEAPGTEPLTYLLAVEADGELWHFSAREVAGLPRFRRWIADWSGFSLDETSSLGLGHELSPVADVSVLLTGEAGWWFEATEPTGAPCWIYRLPGDAPDFSSTTETLDGTPFVPLLTAGQTPGAAVLVFAGFIRDYRGDPSEWEVEIEDLSARSSAPLLDQVTPEEFPRAPRAGRGRSIPLPYGQLERVAPPQVEAGFRGFLTADLEDDELSLSCACRSFRAFPEATALQDAADWDETTLTPEDDLADWPASGYLLVGDEIAFYDQRSDAAFTRVFRGQFMSTPRNHAGGSAVAIAYAVSIRIGEEVLLVTGKDEEVTNLTGLLRGGHTGSRAVLHQAGEAVEELDAPGEWVLSRRGLDEVERVYVLDRSEPLSLLPTDAYTVGTDNNRVRTPCHPPADSPALPLTTVTLNCFNGAAATGPGSNPPGGFEDGDLSSFETFSVTDAGGLTPSLTVEKGRGVACRRLGRIAQVRLVLKYRKPDEVNLLIRHSADGTGWKCPDARDGNGDPVEHTVRFEITTDAGRTAADWTWDDFQETVYIEADAADAPAGTYDFDLFEAFFEVAYHFEESPVLCCDVAGIVSSAFSFPPVASVLRNPADVVYDLLTTTFEEAAIEVDSFRAAHERFEHGDAPISWDVLVDQPGTLFEILAGLLWQANCLLLLEGGRFRLVPIHEEPADEPLELGAADVETESLRFGRGPLEAVVNTWTLTYAPNRLPPGSLQGTRSVSNALPYPAEVESRERYGLRPTRPFPLLAEAISDEISAESLLGLLRARSLHRRPWVVEMITTLKGWRLARYGRFTLTAAGFPALGGVGCTNKTFRCLAVQPLGPHRVFIRGVEA
jgi:hypothetical protein